MIYGDTNSTLAGALAAVKLHIPVVHIEACLRSFNMRMPEEVNRILSDRISKLLLCPTNTAVNHLANENITAGVINVGDVMYDAVKFYGEIAVPSKEVKELAQGEYYLSTVHRAENTDDINRLKGIMNALNDIALKTKVILPLHPRTKKVLAANDIKIDNVIVIDPVGYFDILYLLKNSIGALIDSGGMQKEAYFLNNSCFTLRDETEWTELVDRGANILVGADYEKIMCAVTRLQFNNKVFEQQLFGNGEAGKKIVDVLVKDFY